MAHGVIDHLEIVEIDEDDHGAQRSVLTGHGAIELFNEEAAVGQTREAIVERAVDDLAFAFIDCIDHGVEALRKRGDFGVAGDIDFGDGAAAKAARCFCKLAERAGDAARNAKAEPEAGKRAGERDADEHGVERAVGLHRLIERVAEDEARRDPALQAGQCGKSHELTALRGGQFADGAKTERHLLGGERAGGGNLCLDWHGR